MYVFNFLFKTRVATVNRKKKRKKSVQEMTHSEKYIPLSPSKFPFFCHSLHRYTAYANIYIYYYYYPYYQIITKKNALVIRNNFINNNKVVKKKKSFLVFLLLVAVKLTALWVYSLLQYICIFLFSLS